MKFVGYICAVALAVVNVPSLRADMRVRMFDGYGKGNGGEFDVMFTQGAPAFQFSEAIGTKTWNSRSTRFATFCIERDEFIGFNTEYRATVDTLATGGGNNTNAGDALDPWTAFLYTQLATGHLSNYHYLQSFGATNMAREVDGDSLQQVIWFLENEVSVSGYGYNYDPHSAARAASYLGSGTQKYLWWQMAQAAGWNTLHNVRVLNLTGLDGSEMQSQLIMVPIPAAVALGALGSGLVVVIRRRLA